MGLSNSLRIRRRESKTERIAALFSSRPLEQLSPKEVAVELNMDLQLVTSLVNRLKKEGLVERIDRGRYRLNITRSIGSSSLIAVHDDMRELAVRIFGEEEKLMSGDHDDDPMRELADLYTTIKELGGERMAMNLLNLAASRTLSDSRAAVLVQIIKGVVG